MTQPPHDGGQGPSGDNPEGSASSDPGSPDYAGSPDDGPRRGAHRAGARPTPPPPPPAGAPYWPTPPDAPPGEKLKQPLADTLPVRLLQVGGALLAVVVLVLLLYAFFGRDGNGEKNQGGGTTSHTSAPVTPGLTTSGDATTSAGATSAPATTTGKPTSATSKPAVGKTTSKPATKPPATKPPATKPPTTKPTAPPTTKPPTTKPPTAAPPPVAVKAPLLVLNNSRIHGLAVTGAATFRNGGWTVVGTGNYSGRLPETTVFYAPGSQAAAETLARQFPTVTAVKPRPAGLRADAPLVVVLTRYFKP